MLEETLCLDCKYKFNKGLKPNMKTEKLLLTGNEKIEDISDFSEIGEN